MLAKIKEFFKREQGNLFLAGIIVLTAVISFGLGRLSKIYELKDPIVLKSQSAAVGLSALAGGEEGGLSVPSGEKALVGSKNGTKYHYPWCSGALRIKEENKVWFSSKAEAEAAGYTPASNCEGL